MSYSSEKEPNSLGLAMFASVGFHAVLFVSMAFFPASSETVKKPLRIVNLLPPQPTSGDGSGSQVKTSTLEDILQNPLPDLSAGIPPLGNTSEPPIEAEPNTSSYVGDGTAQDYRVNTSGLGITDPPQRSFESEAPAKQTQPSSSSEETAQSSGDTSAPPSSITPAPNQSPPQPGVDLPPNLPDIPAVAGAVPSPTGPGAFSPFPNSGIGAGAPPSIPGRPLSPGTLNPDSLNPGDIPPSKQRVVPIISETIAYSYPEAACRDQLQGTATLSYYRQPDGTYVDGSGTFENPSGHSILDEAALDAVIDAPASGTGSYQRYSSRFDFIYVDAVCSASGSTTTEADSESRDLAPKGDPGDNKKSQSEPDSKRPEQPDAAPEEQEKTEKKEAKSDEKENSKQPKAPESQSEEKTSSDRPESKPGSPTPAPPVKPVSPKTPEPSPIPSNLPQPVEPPASTPTTPPENSGSASDLLPTQPLEPAAPAPKPTAPTSTPKLDLTSPASAPVQEKPSTTPPTPPASKTAPSPDQSEAN